MGEWPGTAVHVRGSLVFGASVGGERGERRLNMSVMLEDGWVGQPGRFLCAPLLQGQESASLYTKGLLNRRLESVLMLGIRLASSRGCSSATNARARPAARPAGSS